MKLSPLWSSSWIAILLSVFSICPITFAASPASTLFKIPTGSTPGSCDSHDLNQLISDASNMAQASITAINNFQKQSALSAPGPGVLSTREAAWAMFGAPSRYSKILNRIYIQQEGSAILDNVKENYQKVINLLSSTSTLQNGDDPAILACDDSFLKWGTKLQDLTPSLQGSKDGEQTLLSAYAEMGKTFDSSVQGFYIAKLSPVTIVIQDEGVKKPDGSPGGGLCTDGTQYAETWALFGFILCCPRMFQLPANVASVAGSSGGTPKGTHIDTYKTAAGAFLHEMMHFLGKNTATGGKIGDQDINGQKAYQWDQCSLLGTYEPQNALLNADNYHYFAVAASLSNINFGTEGVAR